jgi:nucleoside-diphosphate kinase
MARSNVAALAIIAGATAAWTISKAEVSADSIPPHGVPGTKQERTFIAVKPDGVQRAIVGEIIRRFEAKGYKLVAIKMIRPTEDFAAQHYDDLKSKPFFPGLVKFFSSGPVVAMVWEGNGVIKGGRTLLGATNPADSLPGSIRGDLSVIVGRNICHGSDSAEAAKDEIALWWKPEEVHDFERPQDAWVYDK